MPNVRNRFVLFTLQEVKSIEVAKTGSFIVAIKFMHKEFNCLL